MLLSMTGFGQGIAVHGETTCRVEVRALNSRGLDLFVKLPSIFRTYEPEIRKIVSDQLKRGKIEITVQWNDAGSTVSGIDLEKLSAYWTTLETFARDKQVTVTDNLLSAILQLPELAGTSSAEANEDEWKLCEKALKTALAKSSEFREREGRVLQDDILQQLEVICTSLTAITPFEQARIGLVRERISEHAKELLQSATLNPDRLEQEMVIYIERLDISEEKVRLGAHCDYMEKVCKDISADAGKQLGFIAQEMGREINTIGSKANDANIQHLVVKMKDALERIKEQVNNIL